MKTIIILTFTVIMNASIIKAEIPKTDTISTSQGPLIIHFLGHGTLMFEYNKLIIHVDPYSKVADYSQLPKADLILVTHSHSDHFDTTAIGKIKNKNTQMIYTRECAKVNTYTGAVKVMQNGESTEFKSLKISAVPAYNLIHMRSEGHPYHPKGEGNGYVITFGDKKVYIAGDTENIPEMKELGKIDIAFLPVNLPYTMTPEQAADAARMVYPRILYPYHYGNTDISKLSDLLKERKDIEVRIRKMQ
jgi:L-ascorbate metabolism protein UlaG (beta-lactamase superfamily)